MMTGHICAGLALAISDERYKEHALIINPYLMTRIGSIYEKYLAHSQLFYNKSVLEAKCPGKKTDEYYVLHKKSVEDCKASKEAFLKLYETFVQEVLNQEPYKYIMQKRLVMFLVNRSNEHWVATYLFHPGSSPNGRIRLPNTGNNFSTLVEGHSILQNAFGMELPGNG